MRFACLLLACSALSTPAFAEDAAEGADGAIVVTGELLKSGAATKTDTPAIQMPQPVTIIPAEVFEAQGAVSISDTLNYVAGVQSNPYGPDSRIDDSFVRGVTPLQFRDGMRDVFSYYASIRADPYNFSSVQVLRGPSSVLFGAGSLGGIVNLNSKLPEFAPSGEVSLRYGSFDRIEALADVTGPLGGDFAGRLVARVRDSGTQTDHVPDDRVLVSPSLTWAPTMDTSVTLLGLYQEDDGGSTSQFLPLVGTILPNPNGKLPNDLFIGKPGWDRYDGRLLQGTVLVDHRFSDLVSVSSRARYIDSDLTYLTHYPDSYWNPAGPYKLPHDIFTEVPVPVPDPEQRIMGLYADGTLARMEIFTADTNARFNFDTGPDVEHVVLAGVDYSWNRVRKTGGVGYEFFDIYDIDYDAMSDWNGTLPTAGDPGFYYGSEEDTRQQQVGFYLQDQIRLWDRISVVLGARHDMLDTRSYDFEALAYDDVDVSATTFRAGVIGDLVKGVSPFYSYTESFEPIAGIASNDEPFVPQKGRQHELGVKFQPNDASMITLTAYHIKQTNRPVDDPNTEDPFDQMQAGSLTSKGFEFEATTVLPGQLRVIANYSYNDAQIDGTDVQLDDVPKHNASLWLSRPFELGTDLSLTLAGGARYSGARDSGPIHTPGYTLFDAYASLDWRAWSFSVNATNLFDKEHYSACLARGDCFMGAERNVFGTVSYRF